MAFMPLIMLGGAAKAYNDDVAEKKAKVAQINAVKREWLFKTGMTNIQNIRESVKASNARISEAKRFNFSARSARALEMSGQLEFELDKVKTLTKNGKLSENYVETLSAFLEDRIDNDEDLSAAFAKGLQGDKFVSEEDMSLGLINSIGDLNELQEQFLKTAAAPSRGSLPAFQYTPSKGARIELSDRKSINAQLAGSLNTIYEGSFGIDPQGEVYFTDNATPEVQELFNTLTEKTITLAEDPTNSFSPVSALNTVISSVQDTVRVPAVVVQEKLDEALTTPGFSWDSFRTEGPTIVKTGNEPGETGNNPITDITG